MDVGAQSDQIPWEWEGRDLNFFSPVGMFQNMFEICPSFSYTSRGSFNPTSYVLAGIAVFLRRSESRCFLFSGFPADFFLLS